MYNETYEKETPKIGDGLCFNDNHKSEDGVPNPISQFFSSKNTRTLKSLRTMNDNIKTEMSKATPLYTEKHKPMVSEFSFGFSSDLSKDNR